MKITAFFCFSLFIVFFGFSSNGNNDLQNSDNSALFTSPAITSPCGPDTLTITFPDSLKTLNVKLFWSKNTNPWDSVAMTRVSGNNWRGIINLTGPATYRYYFRATDSLLRYAYAPAGAPAMWYSFVAGPDTVKPVILHTPVIEVPRNYWPTSINANVYDACGIDSVWVRWTKNNIITRRFKLTNISGNIYSGIFNSIMAEVALLDSINYRIIVQDASPSHNKDSTALYSFKIIPNYYCIGSDTVHTAYPFNTYWWGNRTQMLYTASEILASGGYFGFITKIGFYVFSNSGQTMNGFCIRMQNYQPTSLSGFVYSGWTTAYTGSYLFSGTGLQWIELQVPFVWNEVSSLLIEICFGNTSYTTSTLVASSYALNKTYTEFHDSQDACTGFTSPSNQPYRPNLCLNIAAANGINSGNNIIPGKFSLSQNYPNPFNPVTRINYEIPIHGLVTLRVYDILGREVSKLLNEVKPAGSYYIDFNATDLSSGMYFYRLESEGYSDIKKMIIIK